MASPHADNQCRFADSVTIAVATTLTPGIANPLSATFAADITTIVAHTIAAPVTPRLARARRRHHRRQLGGGRYDGTPTRRRGAVTPAVPAAHAGAPARGPRGGRERSGDHVRLPQQARALRRGRAPAPRAAHPRRGAAADGQDHRGGVRGAGAERRALRVSLLRPRGVHDTRGADEDFRDMEKVHRHAALGGVARRPAPRPCRRAGHLGAALSARLRQRGRGQTHRGARTDGGDAPRGQAQRGGPRDTRRDGGLHGPMPQVQLRAVARRDARRLRERGRRGRHLRGLQRVPATRATRTARGAARRPLRDKRAGGGRYATTQACRRRRPLAGPGPRDAAGLQDGAQELHAAPPEIRPLRHSLVGGRCGRANLVGPQTTAQEASAHGEALQIWPTPAAYQARGGGGDAGEAAWRGGIPGDTAAARLGGRRDAPESRQRRRLLLRSPRTDAQVRIRHGDDRVQPMGRHRRTMRSRTRHRRQR